MTVKDYRKLDALVDRIRAEMEARLMTQAEMARITGMTAPTINRILRGFSYSRPGIRRMLEALNMQQPGT